MGKHRYHQNRLRLTVRHYVWRIRFSAIISIRIFNVFIHAEIDQLNQGYRISIVQINEMVTVNFSDNRLETLLFNYSLCNTADGSPWSQIWESLNAMKNKIDVLGMMFLNNKEQALWQLSEFGPIQNIHSQRYPVNGNYKADEIFLGFATRVEMNLINFFGMIHLACALIWLL